MSSYYELLEVPKDASQKEIDFAFNIKAREYNVSKYDGSCYESDEFRPILDAYNVLSDLDKRKAYNNDCIEILNKSEDAVDVKDDKNEILEEINFLKNYYKNQLRELDSVKRKASIKVLLSSGWLILGVGLTVLSYSCAEDTGGQYIVFTGLILGGAVFLLRSLFWFSDVCKSIDNIKAKMEKNIVAINEQIN